jgi:ElaB/YqjD/DUF883 family membrane-anchored ribosome-binding protein
MSEYNYNDADPRTSQPTEAESVASYARLQQALDTTRARLNAAYETAREKSNEALKHTEEYVRESPLPAVGYAVGLGAAIGVVVGLLLGRRD